MRRTVPIRRPPPGADHPVGWKLGVVAVVGLLCGLAIAHWAWSEDTGVHRDEGHARPHGAHAHGPASGSASARATATKAKSPPPHQASARPTPPTPPARSGSAGHAASPSASPGPAATPTTPGHAASPSASPGPAATPTDQGTGPLTFERVRVAYLRCDGAPHAPGPFPCPRDRDLEEATWAILSNLPSCPHAPTHPGLADVHVDFVHRGSPQVRISGGRDDGAARLDADQVLGCVGAALEGVTTTIDADDLRVSFRFRLVAGP